MDRVEGFVCVCVCKAREDLSSPQVSWAPNSLGFGKIVDPEGKFCLKEQNALVYFKMTIFSFPHYKKHKRNFSLLLYSL